MQHHPKEEVRKQHHNKEHTKQHHPEGGREVEAPPLKRSVGRESTNAFKSWEGHFALLYHFSFSLLEQKGGMRRQHHPKGGRRKQHHTKDGWNSSITQHSTAPKERGRMQHHKKLWGPPLYSTLLYVTLICFIVIQPDLVSFILLELLFDFRFMFQQG